MTAMMKLGFLIGAVSVALVASCTKHNEKFCTSDSQCTSDPTLGFCDVSGDFDESGHTSNTCIGIPADCPVDRCGCTPGMPLSCSQDQLTVCNSDGRSTATTDCALGCSTEARCLAFEPSNGLAPALTDASSQPDIVLPGGVTIDTDTGTITDPGGGSFAVKSVLVPQANGPSIRAFEARSFTIDGATVAGSNPLALVAPGSIEIGGILDASASGLESGPGAQDSGACVGSSANQSLCGFSPGTPCSSGGGGGGNATSGGDGGSGMITSSRGGATFVGMTPLLGGCRGGAIVDGATTLRGGGGGGGSVQVVSMFRVEFTSTGGINVGGGGGSANAGGGSAGNLVIEAPIVQITGGSLGRASLAANGGAGGACDVFGDDGAENAQPAAASRACDLFGGNGGTSLVPPQSGTHVASFGGLGGGGGGAAGRASISTRSGDIEVNGAPVLSVVLTKSKLVTK